MSSGRDQGPSHDHGNLQSQRRDRLLGKIPFGTCLGIEIGALHAPTVVRSEGRIFYVDYADAAVLRETRSATTSIRPTSSTSISSGAKARAWPRRSAKRQITRSQAM